MNVKVFHHTKIFTAFHTFKTFLSFSQKENNYWYCCFKQHSKSLDILHVSIKCAQILCQNGLRNVFVKNWEYHTLQNITFIVNDFFSSLIKTYNDKIRYRLNIAKKKHWNKIAHFQIFFINTSRRKTLGSITLLKTWMYLKTNYYSNALTLGLVTNWFYPCHQCRPRSASHAMLSDHGLHCLLFLEIFPVIYEWFWPEWRMDKSILDI
jgi:hypothetical protein